MKSLINKTLLIIVLIKLFSCVDADKEKHRNKILLYSMKYTSNGDTYFGHYIYNGCLNIKSNSECIAFARKYSDTCSEKLSRIVLLKKDAEDLNKYYLGDFYNEDLLIDAEWLVSFRGDTVCTKITKDYPFQL